MIDLSKDVKQFLLRNESGPYEASEKILQMTKHAYPDHNVSEAVVAKVKMLNMFYLTGIQAIDAMALNILRIKNIDNILAQKKYSAKLVNAIAQLELKDSTRTNYSFATKYCALHEPEKYPIYDSIVAAVLTKLMVTGQLPPFVYARSKNERFDDWHLSQGEFEEKMRDYDFFVKVYDVFMEDYGLKGKFTYRQVDWYLWGAYKEADKKTKIEQLAPINTNKYVEYKAPQVKDAYDL